MVKVLKSKENRFVNARVELTRMTAKSGDIVYAVLARRARSGRRYATVTFSTLGEAFWYYKLVTA